MKRYLAAILLAVVAHAHADNLSNNLNQAIANGQITSKEFWTCVQKATVYRLAAQYRDEGMSPQQTLEFMHGLNYASERFYKTAINNVYFDRRFADAGGEGLYDAIEAVCLDPDGKYDNHYQPLQ